MSLVYVAMSGGVDSTVAAAKLLADGHRCVGFTIETGCGQSAVGAASKAASELGIEHRTVDLSEQFAHYVTGPFADEYLRGRTPNPCIECNRHIKFGAALDWALEQGADMIATGHYAKIDRQPDGYRLLRAEDGRKDQTYVLWGMTQHTLAHTLLPAGNITKHQARELAAQLGLSGHDTPDSQDICFVPDGDYCRFIASTGRTLPPAGNFCDRDGNVLGQHRGIANYTVGQRKGLGIALGKPAFVTSIDAATNTVILGDNSQLFSSELSLEYVHYICQRQHMPFTAEVKVRYSGQPEQATVTPRGDGALIEFATPVRAITSGQSAVIYCGEQVIGGGIIG